LNHRFPSSQAVGADGRIIRPPYQRANKGIGPATVIVLKLDFAADFQREGAKHLFQKRGLRREPQITSHPHRTTLIAASPIRGQYHRNALFQINNNGAKPAMVNITNQVVYPVIQDSQFVAADLAIGGTYTLNTTRAGTPCQSTFTTSGTAVSPQYAVSTMSKGCGIVPPNGGAIITLQ
jgi:hypothetical protein